MSTADPRYVATAPPPAPAPSWPPPVGPEGAGPALTLAPPGPDLIDPGAAATAPADAVRDGRGLRRVGRELLHAARGSASREVREQIELAARLQSPVAAPRRLVVAGTHSGVGSATMAGLIGLAVAHHRRDRVVLVDGHPGPMRPLDQLGVAAGWSLSDFGRMERPPTRFDEIRSQVAATASGLYTVPSTDGHPARDRLDPDTYGAGVAVLNRYFAIAVFGCGPAPTYEVVAGAHALVLVTTATPDGAADIRRRLIWLAAQGLDAVVARTVAVFVSRTPGREIDLRAEATALAAMGVGTARLPYDPQLATAAALAPHRIADATRSAGVTIAAEALARATSWT
jgi:MinD-like ATPase involved in chromosome partitioning or flagellar assembly